MWPKLKRQCLMVNAKLDSIADYIFKQAKKDYNCRLQRRSCLQRRNQQPHHPRRRKVGGLKVKTPKPAKKKNPAKTKRRRHVSVATSDSEESDNDDHQAPPTAKERETT